MSSSLLEETRALHEDAQRFERAAAEVLRAPARRLHETVAQQHQVAALVDAAGERRAKLLRIYADEDGMRKRERDELTGGDAVSKFYAQLATLREFHRAHSQATEYANKVPGVEESLLKQAAERQHFSGPEMGGRFLDLADFHQRALNMQQFKKVDYLTFVRTFREQIARVPQEQKTSKEFIAFLEDLHAYLSGFLKRLQPLLDFEGDMREAESEFAEAWKANSLVGWDASVVSDALYCRACQRRFAKDTVFKAHLTGKRHVRAAEALAAAAAAAGGNADADGDDEADVTQSPVYRGARADFLVRHYADVLNDKIHDTLNFVQKKQASTWQELEAEFAELEEEEEADEGDSDEEEGVIYNPKNVPLDWNGKPMPYWLYKLHGLNIYYTCEICGNAQYRGRRAFERHFQEASHQYGMRCLGIPNTKHFHEITKIDEAKVLYERLQQQGDEIRFNAEEEEEFEDNEGHVMSRKLYEDMKREGLIS